MIKRLQIILFLTSILSISVHGFDFNVSDSLLGEEFLKGMNQVPDLARQCKSSWEGQGCNSQDKKQLMSYILFFCGNMPENTHHVNYGLLESYIDSPMLNTAFLRSWSLLNPDLIWPVCIVCFLNYPLDPSWENHFSFCEQSNDAIYTSPI